MTVQHFSDSQIIPLYCSAVILIFSVLFFHLGKKQTDLVLMFVGSLGIGFFIANLDPFLILWDEQYHALVAKNLSKNPLKPVLYAKPILEYNYRNWTQNHIWLHKQPLFLWQIAISIKLFGCNALAVRIPSIILHAIITLFIYRIGKISTTERIGFYGALFFSVAYYPLELVAGRYSTDHNDVSFLFYVTASIWAWFEYKHTQKTIYLILIGLFSGCAILVKWLVGLLIYAVWFLTIGINDKYNRFKLSAYKSLLSALFISLVVFIPWQIYIILNFPLEFNYEYAYNTKHFFEVVENHGNDHWFHFKALKDLYGSGAAIPYIYLLGLIVYIKKIQSKIYRQAVAFIPIIIYGFYSLAATKMTSFCIIAAPFVFLGLGSLVDSMASFLSSKIKYSRFENYFRPVVVIFLCFLLLNLSKIQNYHTDWKPNDNCNRKAELEEIKFIERLKMRLGNQKYVVFNSNVRLNGHIPIMFYTDYIAYNTIPTENQIKQIQEKKYNIAIFDDNSLPEYILRRKDILRIK
jgi:4-amino-4-deoxy-L-arabinose transferase-like glycosyltransferase